MYLETEYVSLYDNCSLIMCLRTHSVISPITVCSNLSNIKSPAIVPVLLIPVAGMVSVPVMAMTVVS